jgi:RNA polymerase sigma-70 factor, ECF subfamily
VDIEFLAAKLGDLPACERAVFVLHDVLGWSSTDIAGLLDTTVGAVETTLRRARDGPPPRAGPDWHAA